MTIRTGVSLLAFLAIIATACGPRAGGGTPAASAQPPGTTSLDDDRTLSIAVALEPAMLGGRGFDATAGNARAILAPLLFNAGLTQQDENQVSQLYLAEARPQLGTDSWKVFPDGRMETTWRLRPNLTWHDGARLVADDFVFSIQARLTLPIAAGSAGGPALAGVLDEISAPDIGTLVVRWKGPFHAAGVSDWQPLPRHILGAAFKQMTPETFTNLPYFTTEFVGVGPYQLERWERGAFIEGLAFPGYVRSQPRIKHIKMVWISDPNTVVANLLAGAVHLEANGALLFGQVAGLKREWAARGEAGTVLLNAETIRYMYPQFRLEYTDPKAILDVRVRQAFAHAIDKQALVDVMLDGEPGIAETGLSNELTYYPELDKVLVKYPLDLRRTEQLMTEAGFRKDGDGFYSQDGNRVSPQIMGIADGRGEREATIVADSWKRAGIDAPIKILTATEARSPELISTFPAFSISGLSSTAVVGEDSMSNRFPTSFIASPANRWSGANKSGYSNPEYDRLFGIFQSTMDANEQARAQIQAEKLLSEQAVYSPLYYSYNVLAHVASLVGPRSAASLTGSSSMTWKVEEWRWR